MTEQLSPEQEALVEAVRADANRFWEKVGRRGEDECWHWLGGAKSFGYGSFSVSGRPIAAHRVSAALAGYDIEGKVVRHRCDTPSCVNPKHLVPGTIADNNRDMWERDRQGGWADRNAAKTHCPKGHALSGDNLRVTPRGLRACRACHREHGRDYMQRRRARLRAIRNLDKQEEDRG